MLISFPSPLRYRHKRRLFSFKEEAVLSLSSPARALLLLTLGALNEFAHSTKATDEPYCEKLRDYYKAEGMRSKGGNKQTRESCQREGGKAAAEGEKEGEVSEKYSKRFLARGRTTCHPLPEAPPLLISMQRPLSATAFLTGHQRCRGRVEKG
jgi:hypothetical protein